MAITKAFSPHELPERAIKTLSTGRESELETILRTVKENISSPTLQHLIISAPRGFGKSFMMRQVQLELEHLKQTSGLPIAIAFMPEEMPHVREPETLIRELTRVLLGRAGQEAELVWHEDDDNAWEESVAALDEAILATAGEHGLAIGLVENFDLLLKHAFPKDQQVAQLRAMLTDPKRRFMLISASASGAFDADYDKPLFKAFKEIPLLPWTIDQCMDFFDRQRELANRPPLKAAEKARAKAVAQFIGGTPRLATLLGDALFNQDVLRAADLLERLVDELTPYYKDRIEALPGRSAKLFDALIRGGEPATQSELVKRVKAKAQSAIAAPFNVLVREQIVTGVRAPNSSEVLYRASDRVFAHYYRRRTTEHGAPPCALESMVDLLENIFSPEEKADRAEEWLRLGRFAEAILIAGLNGEKKDRLLLSKGILESTADILDSVFGDAKAISHEFQTEWNELLALVKGNKLDLAMSRIVTTVQNFSDPNSKIALHLLSSTIEKELAIDGGFVSAERAVAEVSTGTSQSALFAVGIRVLDGIIKSQQRTKDVVRLREFGNTTIFTEDQPLRLLSRYALSLSLNSICSYDEALQNLELLIGEAEMQISDENSHMELEDGLQLACRVAANAGKWQEAAQFGLRWFQKKSKSSRLETEEYTDSTKEVVDDVISSFVALGHFEDAVGFLTGFHSTYYGKTEPWALVDWPHVIAQLIDGKAFHLYARFVLTHEPLRRYFLLSDRVDNELSFASSFAYGLATVCITENQTAISRTFQDIYNWTKNTETSKAAGDYFMSVFASFAGMHVESSSTLSYLKDVLALYFPDIAESSKQHLEFAIDYHSSNRNPAKLARASTDYAQALMAAFPPYDS